MKKKRNNGNKSHKKWFVFLLISRMNLYLKTLQVMEAFKNSEIKKRAPISTMFENIYDKMDPRLKEQMKEMEAHVRHNHDHYPISFHE